MIITLKYSALSPAEVEILFNLLRDPFQVNEYAINEVNDRYVSMVMLDLPLAYDRSFFKIFGMDRWEDMKDVLKNMKWRRGKKNFLLSIHFNGKPSLTFSVNTDSDRTFGKAIDTIEYLIDVILLQINNENLPSDVNSISYEFDEESKWHPVEAYGEKKYVYASGIWMSK